MYEGFSDVINESDRCVAFANWCHKPYITAYLANFGNIIMTQISTSPNNVGKSIRYTWGGKIFIALILVGCAASIYALAQVMMEGL